VQYLIQTIPVTYLAPKSNSLLGMVTGLALLDIAINYGKLKELPTFKIKLQIIIVHIVTPLIGLEEFPTYIGPNIDLITINISLKNLFYIKFIL
jgi:hypothetical protein